MKVYLFELSIDAEQNTVEIELFSTPEKAIKHAVKTLNSYLFNQTVSSDSFKNLLTNEQASYYNSNVQVSIEAKTIK